MNTREKILGALKVPIGEPNLLYKTPAGMMTYLNTLNICSLDDPQGFLGETVFGGTAIVELDGKRKLAKDMDGDNLYEIFMEGMTKETCLEVLLDTDLDDDPIKLKCSQLVAWKVGSAWVRTNELKVGDRIEGEKDTRYVKQITEIGPNIVYSANSLINRQYVLINGYSATPHGVTRLTVYIRHTDSLGDSLSNDHITIHRENIRSMGTRSYYWSMPLDENSEVYLKVDAGNCEAIAYGVELEHKDSKRISTEANIYSKTKALEAVDFGDFVKQYTVNGSQNIYTVRAGYSANVTNIIFSVVDVPYVDVVVKVQSQFGTHTAIPKMRVYTHHHQDYRIGTHLLSNIQLAQNEGIIVETSGPTRVTVYGHENEER